MGSFCYCLAIMLGFVSSKALLFLFLYFAWMPHNFDVIIIFRKGLLYILGRFHCISLSSLPFLAPLPIPYPPLALLCLSFAPPFTLSCFAPPLPLSFSFPFFLCSDLPLLCSFFASPFPAPCLAFPCLAFLFPCIAFPFSLLFPLLLCPFLIWPLPYLALALPDFPCLCLLHPFLALSTCPLLCLAYPSLDFQQGNSRDGRRVKTMEG